MAFKHTFGKNVNDNMQPEDGQPGRAPSQTEDADMYLKKKGYPSPQMDLEDPEVHDKKDRPPRFSTLFGAAPPPPPPPAPREYVREYYPKPERKAGVFIPMPLFIIFAIILFFESTILFAYTVIGLYNNAPSRIFPWAGPGTASAVACDSAQQPAVNIAPNFIIPGQAGQITVTQLVTASQLPELFSTSTSTISSSTSSTASTSTTSSSTTSSLNTAAAVSNIAGIIGGLGDITSSSTPSIAIVTVAPKPSTVVNVTDIFVDPSGNTISAPRQTVFSTTTVDPPAATSTSSGSSMEPTEESSTETTSMTSASPTSDSPETTSASDTTSPSPTKKGSGKVCFGGAGAVQQVCVDADD